MHDLPNNEFFANFKVHQEIQVTLAITSFLVSQASVQRWQHTEARSQQLNAGWDNAELSSLGAG